MSDMARVGIIGGIMVLVIGIIMLGAGTFATSTFQNSINRSTWTAAQNTTWTNQQTQTGQLLSIGGSALIMVGIGLIVFAVRGFGGF